VGAQDPHIFEKAVVATRPIVLAPRSGERKEERGLS
jgi:hypothetical protein